MLTLHGGVALIQEFLDSDSLGGVLDREQAMTSLMTERLSELRIVAWIFDPGVVAD